MGYHGKKQHDYIDRRPAVVIDTNVLIDAMVGWIDHSKASNRERNALFLLEQAFSRYRVCFTRPTMNEFAKVALDLKRQTNIRPTEAMERVNFIKYVEARMTMVEPKTSVLVCRDPMDQMILEAAQGSNAKHIVSADGDILCLQREGCRAFIHPVDFAHMMSARIHEEFERSKRRGKPYVAFGQPNKGGYIKQHGPKSAKKNKPPKAGSQPAQKTGSHKPR